MSAKARDRIAFFLPNLDVGGVERVVMQLSAAFVDAGFIVDLVVGNARGPGAEQVPASVHLVNLDVARTASSTLRLARYLHDRRPAAIIAAKDHANVVAVFASRLARPRIPVVVTVHSRPSDALRSPERWTGRVVRRLIPLAYGRAAAIVAVSPGVADDLQALLRPSAPSVTVIGNPVISPALLEAANAPPPHAWLAADRTEPVVVWCGRLSPEKDPDLALDAVARLCARRPVRLLVVGDGPLRKEFERRIEQLGLGPHVAITGFVCDPAPYLRHADIVVLSSRREGLPTVLIEALALGTRVVATDCPTGPREILADGVYGPLVPVGDVAAMAAALERALKCPDPDLPSEALAPYEVQTAATHYLELLERIGAT